ncbi:hypothetical protein GCM10009687_74140 [Asanoa iriomotensis]|uniref:Uncharacterized protein n=2 Tax=Asanoa iriomotensis TaxID=234613 RepID=A0ABQ4C3Z9_9ACTN|nr:hypothetical protein Air01nite_36130 [Asanoa iriomotensis]
MESVALDRSFRLWSYGIGHSQLLLHARAEGNHDEHLNVLFEGVVAVKVRASCQPLVLQRADHDTRASVLAFAQVPARIQAQILCLALPSPSPSPSPPQAEAGFVACARATVLANANSDDMTADRWNENSRVLHVLTASPATSR